LVLRQSSQNELGPFFHREDATGNQRPRDKVRGAAQVKALQAKTLIHWYSLIMEIRLLTADDAEAWWHLRLEALRNDPASFADSDEEHLKTTIETAQERLRKSAPASNFVVGMFDHGQLIGTAGFFRRKNTKERHKGHIWGVYVRPESRGKGAASALMQEIVRRARDVEGVEQITLVASANFPAQHLYTAMGFQGYGIEPHSLKIGAEYVDDVLMVLFLS
jgi:ribosomal protein S18 acetylase RimI-like enzyme